MPKRLILCLILILSTYAAPLVAAVPDVLRATAILRSDDDEDLFLGSAFAVGDTLTVVSNAHVVGTRSSVVLETWDGTRMRAEVVAVDPLRDLVLLRPEAPLPAALIPGSAPDIGSPVLAAGAPLDSGLSLSAGIVSATGRQIDPREPVRYLQHTAPVNPGSSGGPLVDATGQLVGINTRIADGSRFFAGIAYAVPVGDLLAFLADPTRPAPERPGLRVRAISRAIARALDVTPGDGVLVDDVAPGGPAARAGVRGGDILIEMNGRPVTRPGDIALILADGPGPARFVVLREGGRVSLVVPAATNGDPLRAAALQQADSHRSYGLGELGMQIDASGEVQAVTPGSLGFYTGLTPGDVILSINGQPVAGMAPGWPEILRVEGVTLLLLRLSDGSTRHILLDPWAKAPKLRPASGANVLDQSVVSFE